MPKHNVQDDLDEIRYDFGRYYKYMNTDFLVGKHHYAVFEAMHAIMNSEVDRLIVSMPPRHSKSETISHNFPPFYLGHYPKREIIQTTYAQDFANKFGRSVRDTLRYDEKYHNLFPETLLNPASKSAKAFATTAGGNYYAIGRGGPITGKGGHIIIIDDPLKNRQEAQSEVIRAELWDWYKGTLVTRQMPGPATAIIIIATRWHEDDLTGKVLQEEGGEDKWLHINCPAINEKTLVALWPEWMDYDRLMEIKSEVGEYEWEAQYMQRPSNPEGMIIKRDCFHLYETPPPEEEIIAYYWSLDTAVKEKTSNDYSVMQYWAETKNGYYLLKMLRKKMDFPALKKICKFMFNLFPANEILIEDKQSGQQLIQELRDTTTYPVIAMVPGKNMPMDKVARANFMAPYVEAGLFHLPKNKKFTEVFLKECASFPNGSYDDMVDTVTQFIARVRRKDRFQQLAVGMPVEVDSKISGIIKNPFLNGDFLGLGTMNDNLELGMPLVLGE